MITAAAHHRLQLTPSSCVAAACRMVLSWRGLPDVEEHQICDQMACGECVDLLRAAQFLGCYGETWDLSNATHLQLLTALLRRGEWVITNVGGPALEHLNLRRIPPLRSLYGQLASPGWAGRCMMPLHALVLVEATAHAFGYLDPWFPAEGQPLTMTREHFIHIVHGDVCIPTWPPRSGKL